MYVITEKSKDKVLYNAFLSAYWLSKEEVVNRKFKSLLELEEMLGVSEIHRFQHRSQGSQRELFSFLAQALKNDLLKKVQAANSYGLLVDEVTNVNGAGAVNKLHTISQPTVRCTRGSFSLSSKCS